MRELKDKIEKMCAGYSGDKAYIVEDLETGDCISLDAAAVFPAASLIKLPILLTLFRLSANNGFDLNERIRIQNSDKVQGFGVLKDLGEGLCLTYYDLAVLMITLSDNTATNLLIDRIGLDTINEAITQVGMAHTILGRKMMDVQAKEKGLDNFTCAEDIRTVYQEILKDEKSTEMLDILFRQQCNNKLPVYMKENAKFAHKTGDLPGVEHDAGILFTEKKRILLMVLTKNLDDNRDGITLNNEIGKSVFQYYSETGE